MDKEKFKTFKIPKDTQDKQHAKYVRYGNYGIIDHMSLGTVAWMLLFAWNTLIFGLSTPRFDSNDYNKHQMSVEKAVKQRMRDTFYPISNGWHTSVKNENYVFGHNFKYKYDESAKDTFKPRIVWYVNTALLLVAACWVCGLVAKKSKQRRNNKAQEDMVDVMLKLPFVGCDPKQVKKLMKIAPEIVSHMSLDRRVYFDALLHPNEYTDIKDEIMNNGSVRRMVIEIMAAHLQSHPEDRDKVMHACAINTIAPHDLLDIKSYRYGKIKLR